MQLWRYKESLLECRLTLVHHAMFCQRFIPEGTLVQESNKVLTAYNKQQILALGTARVSMRNPKTRKKYNAEFVVVEDDFVPLIGARAAQQMGLLVVQHHNIQVVNSNEVPATSQKSSLTKEQVLTDFADIFKGLGKMEGKLHLEVDESVSPVIMPPRRVPVALKGKFKEELDRLISVGVLEKVEQPSKWVSAVVVTAKPNGKVRVCIDPRPLNQALRRSHYPLPVIDDILPELGKARVFSKADLKDGFLQIELDDESSHYTTFQTPWGRHRWKRMPYGISPAPEYFQQKLDQNLEGLEGVYRIADDLLIIGQGESKEEADRNHDSNLVRLFQRCRERNIKLNKAKFEFKCRQVPFIGHLLSSEGVKPDPRKIEAIVNMQTPTDVQGVQRLIGMVKYLSKFLSNLSELCQPLRKLTHKDVPWQWTQEQEDAFQSLKTAVTQAPVLKYFSPQAQTEGQGDASQNGLGFVLLQEGQPVTYASRALTPAEQRYSQIEKELLAQVFGLEHNHHYTFGRHVVLWTDHKPLVSIYKKPLVSAPKRLQRLLIRLQQYDVDLRYKPGSEMYLADTLSRAFTKTTDRSRVEEETESIHAIDFLPISEPQLREIQAETAQDDALQQLKKLIVSGWPDTKQEVPVCLHPYFAVRDELSVQDGLIFKGQRCVIPVSLRARIKEKLHGAHTGIQSCLRRAREAVYWPGMNSDLTDYISKCDICSSHQSSQAREPLICHEIADRPWQKIGADIFTLDGVDYLCVVDYYSNYFEIDQLESKTAVGIAKKLRKQFSVHGIPNQLISDNMPFNSQEFRDFATTYEFEVIISSPGYPQSNGKAENAIKTAKNIMKKAKQAGTDVYLSLLDWRNTPSEGMSSSPAQRMFGRRTRTLLPTSSLLLKPKVQEDVKEKLIKQKSKQTKYYNRSSKELPPLRAGEVVRVAPKQGDRKQKWFKARVEDQVDIRSYEVRTEDGKCYRRNRRHLRQSKESFDQTPHLSPTMSSQGSQSSAQFTTAEPVKHNETDQPAQDSPDCQLKQPESVVVPPNQKPSSGPAKPTIIVTRSGRVSRTPQHLKDFVTVK